MWLVVSGMTTRKTRSTRTKKKTDSDSGLLSPPSSTGDKAGDHDAAGPSSLMISPTPEEDEDQRSKASQVFSTRRLYLISVSQLRSQSPGMPVLTTSLARILIKRNSSSLRQANLSKACLKAKETSFSNFYRKNCWQF